MFQSVLYNPLFSSSHASGLFLGLHSKLTMHSVMPKHYAVLFFSSILKLIWIS